MYNCILSFFFVTSELACAYLFGLATRSFESLCLQGVEVHRFGGAGERAHLILILEIGWISLLDGISFGIFSPVPVGEERKKQFAVGLESRFISVGHFSANIHEWNRKFRCSPDFPSQPTVSAGVRPQLGLHDAALDELLGLHRRVDQLRHVGESDHRN